MDLHKHHIGDEYEQMEHEYHEYESTQMLDDDQKQPMPSLSVENETAVSNIESTLTGLGTSNSVEAQLATSFSAPQRPATQMISTIEDPVIHNIVATANFCCSLDLEKIVVRVRNAEYNPKRFRAVIMRIFDPRTTAMLFSSGKIVCTGAKSERLACIAARKYGRIMQKLGYDIKFSEFKIQNIVSTVDIKFPVRLDKLALVHSQFCTYDPDFFPALIYRMVRPRTVLLIFVSGKIIITGAKSRNEVIETINHMTPVLSCFRKQ